MALCYVFVGKTQSGKTTEAIALAESFGLREIWANDVRREYAYRMNKKIRPFHGSSENWIKLIGLHDFQGSRRVFICDEAGDYFPHGSQYAELTKPVRGKRFNGNVYIIVFHELQEVPQYVLRFTDCIVIKKSRGTPTAIAKKYENYPDVIEAWNEANDSDNPYFQKYVWL